MQCLSGLLGSYTSLLVLTQGRENHSAEAASAPPTFGAYGAEMAACSANIFRRWNGYMHHTVTNVEVFIIRFKMQDNRACPQITRPPDVRRNLWVCCWTFYRRRPAPIKGMPEVSAGRTWFYHSDILPIRTLIITRAKKEVFSSIFDPLAFEQPAFRKGAEYLKSKSILLGANENPTPNHIWYGIVRPTHPWHPYGDLGPP